MPVISIMGPQEDEQSVASDPRHPVVFLQSFPNLASARARKAELDRDNPTGTTTALYGNKFRDQKVWLCPVKPSDGENEEVRSYDLFRVPIDRDPNAINTDVAAIVDDFGQGGKPTGVGN